MPGGCEVEPKTCLHKGRANVAVYPHNTDMAVTLRYALTLLLVPFHFPPPRSPPISIPVKSTDFGGSLPIFLPLPANLPIYHNLPISTDFFADLPNFNFFYRTFMYLW